MPHATHKKTALAIVREHVEDWRRANRWSRETLADQIVQAHERIGGPSLTGIKFEPPTTDTFERQRVNADRIYRWLDDVSKDKNHLPFNFLPSILSALPDERRLQLVEELLAPVGLGANYLDDEAGEATPVAVSKHFHAVVEHTAAATVTMSTMLDGIDPGEPEQASKKLSIAAATLQRARGLVNRIIKQRQRRKS